MNIKTVSTLFFSPTHTTRTVVKNIAKGMDCEVALSVNITRQEVRDQAAPKLPGDLVIIGVPVYGGRVPKIAAEYLNTLEGSGIPAVVVAVYGNREFEDALLELKDTAVRTGFIPVAGAAFIGEHSFSHDTHPIAPGRPDSSDRETARNFGRTIARALAPVEGPGSIGALEVPGNSPYKDLPALPVIPFIEVLEDCDECNTCAVICPVQAIDAENGFETDDALCIRCCACIKVCPRKARQMTDSPLKEKAVILHRNCSEPKAPELFFAAGLEC